jgi:uncharacterized protein (DUF885 family)
VVYIVTSVLWRVKNGKRYLRVSQFELYTVPDEIRQCGVGQVTRIAFQRQQQCGQNTTGQSVHQNLAKAETLWRRNFLLNFSTLYLKCE